MLTSPEFDWVVSLLEFWVSAEGRARFPAADRSLSMWPGERAGQITLRSFDRSFQMFRALAGLPPELSMHALRHSYVTHQIEAGYDPAFIQVLLSPPEGVYDVNHEAETSGNLRTGSGYLRSSVTQMPRRFDACSARDDARLVA